MNLVDANVLLYAVNEADPKHGESREWLDGAMGGDEPVGLAWTVLLAFVRLSTKVGLFPRPLPGDAALARVRAWLGQPPSVIVEPTVRHVDVLAGLLSDVGPGANLVNDAHLAALALEHNARVITYDSDFGRFTGVGWRRPSAHL
ncbi:MAG: type II toxin-antitoxin system VapC family toxin [Actinomycetota bacterium]|nr:type II toxin-antitoxin system VapC family toxin [Actinomycetota bacterium]